MTWAEIGITGGVVKTRDDSVLVNGEVTEASGCRLSPGDTAQVRNGRAQSTLAALTPSSGFGQLHYMSFENGIEAIVVCSSSGSAASWSNSVKLYTTAGVLLATVYSGTDATKVSDSDIIPRGNQWFLGTAVKDWVFGQPASGNIPSYRETGMVSAASWPVVPTFNPEISFAEAQDYENNDAKDGSRNKIRDMKSLLEGSGLGALAGKNIFSETYPDIRLDSRKLNHLFVYWMTEYDSVNDIESDNGTNVRAVYVSTYDEMTEASAVPVAGESEAERLQDIKDGAKVTLSAVGIVPANSNTDKVRFYRAYMGRVALIGTQNKVDDFLGARAFSQKLVNGERGLVGGLVQEIAIGSSVEDYPIRDGFGDTPITYPQVQVVNRGVVKLDPFLVKPNPWYKGTMVGDSLLMADVANRQTTYYTFPGAPEYQPRTAYRELVLSEKSDQITGMHYVNDVGVVLTESGATRFNYLAFEGEGFRDKQQSRIAGRNGCVSLMGSDVVESSGGEWVVWISRQGLMMTDGNKWRDACPDFRVQEAASGADLSKAVLINDPRDFRVCLYLPGAANTTRWDFYYHPSLMKGNGFRLMGPHSVSGTVLDAARGSKDGEDRVFLLMKGDSLVLEGEGFEQSATFTTKRFMGRSPSDQISVRQTGLRHSPIAFEARIDHYTSSQSGGVHLNPPVTVSSNGAKTFDYAHSGVRGNEFQVKATVTSGNDWRIGPVWVEIQVTGGGNG